MDLQDEGSRTQREQQCNGTSQTLVPLYLSWMCHSLPVGWLFATVSSLQQQPDSLHRHGWLVSLQAVAQGWSCHQLIHGVLTTALQ